MRMLCCLLGVCLAGAATPGSSRAQAPALPLDTLAPSAADSTGGRAAWGGGRAGGARVVVDGETLRRTGESSLVAALSGRVPNLDVTRSGGEAGSAAAARIRGPRSFAGGGPLVVVDGLPVSDAAYSTWAGFASPFAGLVGSNRAADIDLDDVESVEVLAGSASAARFGARGGAGAILVTTKRGAAGRTVYTLQSSAGFDRAAGLVPLQRDFGVGLRGRSTACAEPDCSVGLNGVVWGPRLPEGTPTFDHAAELFGTGTSFDHSLSVSGGSGRSSFRASGGLLARDGYFTGDRDTYDRRTLRLNATHRLRDDLVLDANVSLARTAGRYAPRANGPSDLLLAGLRTPPEFDNREYLTSAGLHRSYRFPHPQPGSELASRGIDNPFYALYEGENTQDVTRVFGSAGATWRPLGWLRADYTLGVDGFTDDRLELRPFQGAGAPAGGTVGSWRLEERTLRHALDVAAEYALGPTVTGSLAAGHELDDRRLRNVRDVRSGRGGPGMLAGGGGASRAPQVDAPRRRLTGYSVRGTLDFADRLSLAGSLRGDGLSVSGVDRGRAWYPGGSVAWSFARALRLPGSLVDAGILRLGYGRGGREPEPYLLQDLALLASPPGGGPGVAMVSARALRDAAALRPEVTSELEAGVHLGLLRGKAELGVTHFRADSRDVVLPVPAPSAGEAPRLRNAGEIRNQGWEVALGVRPYTRPGLAVELGMHWARTRNRVLDLGGAEVLPFPLAAAGFVGSRAVAEVGRPLGVVRGLDFVRCGRGLTTVSSGGVTHDVAAACRDAPDGALFLAPDGFPVRDPAERVIADPNPDWTGGVTVDLRVRGVRVGARVDTRQGGQTLNLTRAALYQHGTHGDTGVRGTQVTFGVDWMRGPVVGPGVDRLVTVDESWFTTFGGMAGPRAQFVEDASVTRLRELSLAYTFEAPWLRRALGLAAVDARVSGRDLFAWTPYTGHDPEAGAASASRGIDWFANPPSRALELSLALTR